MIATFFLALGLVLVVEGLVYALAPSLVEQLLAALRALPEQTRRLIGLVSIAIGLVLVWCAKMLGA
ncbi:MAG: DUF2065 family protein [Roseovarius sp.]|uniref:DUF2065 domain-containing protein n=1 Tax=Roseovarius sp. TaxID=1486281 RepID=UPI0032EFD941